MLEKLIRLYTMAMAYDVRSPMPHLVGPAGCGKSSSVEALADLLDVDLHIINVSRLSPLEVEGVQMPHGTGEEMILKMLPATWWTQLKEGDILLMDEFLRGFPEVYNGLLDIFTSRRVGTFRLPRVFIIGASNSVVTYDFALEDRLLHIPVADPRRSVAEKKRLGKLLIDAIGLLPSMVDSTEMDELLNEEVLPTYEILDSFKKQGTKGFGNPSGSSLRNLIGQAQLRHVESTHLRALIDENNRRASGEAKYQFMVLLDGNLSKLGGNYAAKIPSLLNNDRLTDLQHLNLTMNVQLIEMHEASTTTEEDPVVHA